MKVTEIRNVSAAEYNIPAVYPDRMSKSNDPKELDALQTSKDKQSASLQWQKDILMEGLSKLENSIQMDNNHPLDTMQSKPIESFKEALIELSLTRLPEFETHLADSQANIKAEDIVSLFTEEVM